MIIIISQIYINIFNLKRPKTLKMQNQLRNMLTEEIYVQFAKSTNIMYCIKTSESESYLKTYDKSCTNRIIK